MARPPGPEPNPLIFDAPPSRGSVRLATGADLSDMLDALPERIAVPSTPGFLSPVERRVLELIARGTSYAEIAQTMGEPEEWTARFTEKLRDKLGARDDDDAVAIARRRGELD
jgi:DNA-binding CsgD family transcriptional regulator